MLETSNTRKRFSIDYLFLSQKLEESGSGALVLSSIVAIFVSFVILLVWAFFTQIDEIATADGEIKPLDSIYTIQHLEGGIVEHVWVEDGAIVNKGAPLFALQEEQVSSDLQRLKKRINTLELEIFLQQALLSDVPYTENDFMKTVRFAGDGDKRLVELQVSNSFMLYQQQKQEIAYNQQELKDRISHESGHLDNIKEQIENLIKRRTVVGDQVKMFSELLKSNSGSKVNLLNAQDRLQEVIGDYLGVLREETEAKSKIIELQDQLQQLMFKKEGAALEQLQDLTSELLEVQQQLSRAQDTFDRLQVKAPISGIIKGLELTPGGVIAPAQALFEIIPTDSKLIAEVKVSTDDIGHIKLNDPVQVKVSTYDFSAYGHIAGAVDSISASTFLNEKNVPYYKAIVRLDKHYLGLNPKQNPIFPGMLVIADIKTNQRSLIKYLLKPVNRTFQSAFRER